MSKRKRKNRFDAPSQTSEKYKQSFDSAKSEDTIDDLEEETKHQEVGGTDDGVADNILSTRPLRKKDTFWQDIWKGFCVFAIIVSVLVSLGGVIVFFVSLKSEVTNVSSNVTDLKTEVGDLSKESSEQHNKTTISITRILEKFDRLFDRLTPRRDSKEQ